MSAFAALANTLFADENLSAAATYHPKAGAAVALRVLRLPRQNTEFTGFDVGASAPAERAEVRASDVAQPREGDTLKIGDDRFRVRKAEKGDEGLTWLLDLDRQV